MFIDKILRIFKRKAKSKSRFAINRKAKDTIQKQSSKQGKPETRKENPNVEKTDAS